MGLVSVRGRLDGFLHTFDEDAVVELPASSGSLRVATFRPDGTLAATGALHVRMTDTASGRQRYVLIAPDPDSTLGEVVY
jgi:hypothetical protein